MGLKSNIVYSAILTTANYLFQFITFPYVSRILGPSGIGTYNFAYSIVQYFMMFAAMGVINLGTREIAKCTSQKQRDEVFTKILITNGAITVLSLSIYLPLIFLVPSFQEIKQYLYIGILQIIFNAITIEWLFRGLQDFKFITLRSVLVRVGYVILVFILIRKPDDVLLYYTLTIFSIIFNGIINWGYSRKFVSMVKVPILEGISQFAKPMFLLGSQALISFFYVGFNTVYLGIESSETQVGYYSTANKIIIIILALYTAYSSTIMPRMSKLVDLNQNEEMERLIITSIELVCAFAFPAIILILCCAKTILNIIAGSQFISAASALQIGALLVLVLGISQVIFVQLFIPQRMDKRISISCASGAVLSLILNFFLVGLLKLGADGSMFIWLTSETMVLTIALGMIHKEYKVTKWIQTVGKYLVAFLPLLTLNILISFFELNQYLTLSICLLLIVLYTHIILYKVFRQTQYLSIVNMIHNKFR